MFLHELMHDADGNTRGIADLTVKITVDVRAQGRCRRGNEAVTKLYAQTHFGAIATSGPTLLATSSLRPSSRQHPLIGSADGNRYALQSIG
jgi:hypothetical protein